MVFGLVTLLAACTHHEERLAERRAEVRTRIDALYAEYGATQAPPPGAPPREASREGTFDAGEYIGNAVRTADRELFVATCIELGSGGRPSVYTERARDYFAQSTTKAACAEVAALTEQVRTLEAELARP